MYNDIKDFTGDEIYEYLTNVNTLYAKSYLAEGIEDEIERIDYSLCPVPNKFCSPVAARF